MKLKPIGIIRTSLKEACDAPIQGIYRPDSSGTVEVFAEYEEGLDCIDGFSHLILLYWFHLAGACKLKTAPFLEPDSLKGIFSIRKPARPNPIGLSVVKLVSRDKNILKISEADMLDGTPLLDIKPLVPQYDYREGVKIGWLEEKLRVEKQKEECK